MLSSSRWQHVGKVLNEEARVHLNLAWHRLDGMFYNVSSWLRFSFNLQDIPIRYRVCTSSKRTLSLQPSVTVTFVFSWIWQSTPIFRGTRYSLVHCLTRINRTCIISFEYLFTSNLPCTETLSPTRAHSRISHFLTHPIKLPWSLRISMTSALPPRSD